MVEYIAEDELLNLINLKYLDYSLTFKIQVSPEFHQDNIKLELKKYLNSLIELDSYSLEILKKKNQDVLVIKFPPFLEIVNSKANLEKHKFLDKEIVFPQDSLEVTFSNLLNSSHIANFEINKSEDSNSYNLTFPK